MEVNNIQDVLNFATISGFDNTTVTDISYVILENTYGDIKAAYYSLHGKDSGKTEAEIKSYDESELIECIRGYMISQQFILSKVDQENSKRKTNISLEENREGMIELIEMIRQAVDEKKMSKKDGIAKEIDLRTRLQNKFDIEQADNTLHIVVNNKFNSICPYCNHEISIKQD